MPLATALSPAPRLSRSTCVPGPSATRSTIGRLWAAYLRGLPLAPNLPRAPAHVNVSGLGRGAARRYAGGMQVDTSTATGSGIPSTVSVTGSAGTFAYTDTITGGAKTGRIVWVDWYSATARNGSAALVGCEGVSGGPPPPPP